MGLPVSMESKSRYSQNNFSLQRLTTRHYESIVRFTFQIETQAVKDTRMSKVTVRGGGSGIGLAGLLGLLFIGLKLGGVGVVATWSWFWVLSPFWISIAFLLAILAVSLLVLGVLSSISR